MIEWAPWVTGFIALYFGLSIATEAVKQVIITRGYKARVAIWQESDLPVDRMPRED